METSSRPTAAPSGPELRMLEVLYETFSTTGEWPTFQYASTSLWQELEVEPREIYFALSTAALVWPVIDRDHSFSLRDDTRAGVSLRGLMHLRGAASDIGLFVQAVRYMAERAAQFRPSAATDVEELLITSEEFRLVLGLPSGDYALARLHALLRDQAPFLWLGLGGPDTSGAWTVTLNHERARRFRHIHTLIDFFAVETEIRGGGGTHRRSAPKCRQ
jgi:hypothetical protein